MNFEKFLITGWKITLGKYFLIYGTDSRGNYYRFNRTYIRTW